LGDGVEKPGIACDVRSAAEIGVARTFTAQRAVNEDRSRQSHLLIELTGGGHADKKLAT
jgi:hypothetical protein